MTCTQFRSLHSSVHCSLWLFDIAFYCIVYVALMSLFHVFSFSVFSVMWANMPMWRWRSTSSPRWRARGSWWRLWTADNCRRCTVWPTSTFTRASEFSQTVLSLSVTAHISSLHWVIWWFLQSDITLFATYNRSYCIPLIWSFVLCHFRHYLFKILYCFALLCALTITLVYLITCFCSPLKKAISKILTCLLLLI